MTPTSAGKVAYGKLDEDVILTRVDSAMTLTIMSVEKIDQFQRALDVFLNTRPESPRWLLDLSDAINPVSVPERYKDRA